MFELIRANKRRSTLLIVCFVGLLTLVGLAVGQLIGNGVGGTVVALVVSGGVAFLSYWKADAIALAVSRATRQETFMRMVELQPGYGFGVQQFRLVLIFETPQAFDQFVYSGWEFGGNAMATAQTDTQSMGSRLGAVVAPGVLMYQFSDQGAMVGVSITGAKYYPDPDLN